MNKNRNRKYTNGTITVIWQPGECIHSAICFTTLRAVFNPIRRPWVDMSAAETEEIIDTVEKCPSEALTFFWHDNTKNQASQSPKIFDKSKLSEYFDDIEPEKSEDIASAAAEPEEKTGTVITFKKGNPLIVKGNFKLENENGEATELKVATFCRCGLSARQPFCDGSHIKTEFDK